MGRDTSKTKTAPREMAGIRFTSTVALIEQKNIT